MKMRSSRNLFQSVQNLSSRQFRSYHHQFRQREKPVNYPVRTMNYKDPIDDMRNYYKILGVERCASHSEIKNAYYYLAKQYHPDNRKTGRYEEQFNEIVEAYNVLIDDNKRNEYDKFGEIKDIQGYMKRIGEREKTKNINERVKLRDLLQKDLPKSRASEISTSLQSSEASINIEFLQSVQGMKRDFVLKILRKCPRCTKTYLHKSPPEKCKKCDGSGISKVQSKTHITNKVCDLCKGKRVTQMKTCNMCDNKGFVYQNQPVYIVIPPGISNGDIINIKNPNSEIPNKSIAVKVNVMNSTKFERKGFNIHSDLAVSIPDAILGGKVKVQTIHGMVDLRIPPGAESHSTITLHGKGIRTPRVIGDHILTLKVDIPKTINENVRKVLSQWNLEKKKK